MSRASVKEKYPEIPSPEDSRGHERRHRGNERVLGSTAAHTQPGHRDALELGHLLDSCITLALPCTVIKRQRKIVTFTPSQIRVACTLMTYQENVCFIALQIMHSQEFKWYVWTATAVQKSDVSGITPSPVGMFSDKHR